MEKFTKIFFAAIFLITISSCEKKSCKNVTCPADQTCYQGKCLCYDGYEGANCTTLSANKYAGQWQGSESNCNLYNQYYYGPYSVSIFAAGGNYGTNAIVLSNFMAAGNVTAYIQNTDPNNLGNTLYIPSQSPGSNVQISASFGTYYPSTLQGGHAQITININFTVGGISNQCTETLYQI